MWEQVCTLRRIPNFIKTWETKHRAKETGVRKKDPVYDNGRTARIITVRGLNWGREC